MRLAKQIFFGWLTVSFFQLLLSTAFLMPELAKLFLSFQQFFFFLDIFGFFSFLCIYLPSISNLDTDFKVNIALKIWKLATILITYSKQCTLVFNSFLIFDLQMGSLNRSLLSAFFIPGMFILFGKLYQLGFLYKVPIIHLNWVSW